MLCFRNWRQACALMPSFLDTLRSIGMKVNFNKSCVIVDAVLLHAAAAATECTSPLLREFQWSETTPYLNRPFGYEVSVETLCQQVVQKVHAAWGSLKGILGRRWWTNPCKTDLLLTKHRWFCISVAVSRPLPIQFSAEQDSNTPNHGLCRCPVISAMVALCNLFASSAMSLKDGCFMPLPQAVGVPSYFGACGPLQGTSVAKHLVLHSQRES